MILLTYRYNFMLFLLFFMNTLAFTYIFYSNVLSMLRIPMVVFLLIVYVLVNFRNKIVFPKAELGVLSIIYLFVFWLLGGVITSLDPINSLVYFLWLFLNICLIYGITSKVKTDADVLNYIFSLIIVIFIFHLISVILFNGNSIVHRGENIGFKGIFQNNNTFGMISMLGCISTICMLGFKRYFSKRVFVFLRINIIITFLTTVLSNSRASIVGLVLAFVMLCIFNKKFKRVLALSSLFILIYSISIDKIYEYFRINSLQEHGLFSDRTGLYNFAVKSFKDIPIQGLGIGRQEDLWRISKESYPINLSNELIGFSFHNSYLQIIIETGFLGMVLFLMIIFVTIYNFKKIKTVEYKKVAQAVVVILSGLLCNGFFESSLLLPGSPISIVFWLLILLINKIYYLDSKSEKKQRG
ncbi:O-antigen ligase family protein [Bacillus sp. C1]